MPADYQARIDQIISRHFLDGYLPNRVRNLFDEVGPLLTKIYDEKEMTAEDRKTATDALHEFGGLAFIVGAHATNYQRALTELEKRRHPMMAVCSHCKTITEPGKMYWHLQGCEEYQKLLEERNAPRD